MRLVPLILLSLFVWQDALGDEEVSAEHQALLKIDRHLAELTPLIKAAEQSADPDSRIRFRYDWLQRDIATVRKGVQAEIHKSLAQKLANAPLHDDYRR